MHTAYFFNSRDGDRVYNADSFGEWLKPFFTNGVFDGDLVVTANGDMTVTVAGGNAFINGKCVCYTTSETFDLEVASGTLNRIDSVVLRRDDTERDIYLTVLTGGYANSPVAPELSRSDGLYDLKLCDIYVATGTITIEQENITDTRLDSEVCGFVAATVEQVDTSTLFQQYLDWFNTFTSDKETEMTEWQEEQSAAFIAWYNETTGIWDDEAHARLDEIMDAIDELAEHNGVWDNTVEYKRYSVVTYTADGETKGYLAINTVPVGTLPTDETYWTPVSLKGDKGQDAVVTDIDGSYCFQVEDGHLYLYYPDDVTAPDFSIDDSGHLILEI